MKVGARCGYCLLHRGYMIVLRSTDDEGIRLRAVADLLRLLADGFRPDTVPSYLGTDRDRLIKRVTGCPDAYADAKRLANARAMKLMPRLTGLLKVAGPEERFRMALKISCIGNVIEYDLPEHTVDIDEALGRLGEDFFIDDTDGLRKLAVPGAEFLLLTDNAGEIAFDGLVVRELKQMGCWVTVVVKGGPSLNDALLEDARDVGMMEAADEVITTGADAIGIRLEECSDEFREKFYGADAIIAKGMANWETLTELPAPSPTMYLLMTKCEPVAESVGAPLNRCVAKLVPAGWRL